MLTRKDFIAPYEPDYAPPVESPYTRLPNVLCYEFLHSFQDYFIVTFAYQYDLDCRDHEVLVCSRFLDTPAPLPPGVLQDEFNLRMAQVCHSLRRLIEYALSNNNGEQYLGNAWVDLEHWRLILKGTKRVMCSEDDYQEL